MRTLSFCLFLKSGDFAAKPYIYTFMYYAVITKFYVGSVYTVALFAYHRLNLQTSNCSLTSLNVQCVGEVN